MATPDAAGGPPTRAAGTGGAAPAPRGGGTDGSRPCVRVDGERGTAAELQEPHIGGWYAAGLVVQCLLWALLFLSIVLAVLGGAGVSEFRYVGF